MCRCASNRRHSRFVITEFVSLSVINELHWYCAFDEIDYMVPIQGWINTTTTTTTTALAHFKQIEVLHINCWMFYASIPLIYSHTCSWIIISIWWIVFFRLVILLCFHFACSFTMCSFFSLFLLSGFVLCFFSVLHLICLRVNIQCVVNCIWLISFLTAWIITFTVALFTGLSPWCGRCHLFWFIFGDNNCHRIHGDFARLGSGSINIGQTCWILFVFRFWSWHFWWFWICCACAIWNTRCSSLLSY